MQLDMLLAEWQRDGAFMEQVQTWRVESARCARYADIPRWMHRDVVRALQARGLQHLYTHQREVLDCVQMGHNAMVITPTASGKTMCYNLPVLNAVCQDPSARALYLFPTKALSQDQVAELHGLVSHLESKVQSFTYDGDTPMHARQKIREAGHIVVTNPDMLHAAILPHHTKWLRLFENLKYVVIDEAHIYRGVFGSHVANVIRRLLRICSYYGAKPQFILSSATVANPQELGRTLTGQPVTVVSESGAPTGERHFVFYNPPIVQPQLGLRRSSMTEARRIGQRLLQEQIPTIAFVKTRTQVEVLSAYWKADASARLQSRIFGYRGGYLPNERRRIEQNLRNGEIIGVVSTNALELGVDIGSLDASITVGYPGTIASLRQQSGRAGRRRGLSMSLYIANASLLDQYIVTHPQMTLDGSPEAAHVYPENLLILMDHLKCAAYELPFSNKEQFGVETTNELLTYLTEHNVLNEGRDGRFYWMSDALPSHSVSLRSAAQDNVVIIDSARPKPTVIGETDRFSALTTLHEEAIYLHQSKPYQVEKLDLENGKAFVRAVNPDYYTDAELSVTLRVLDVLEESAAPVATHCVGEVMVNALATLFKKIKFDTHENLGWGKIHLPEAELHTIGYWCSFQPSAIAWSQDAWESALLGTAHVLRYAGALHCMCAVPDLHVSVQVRDLQRGEPTLYLYDAYPSGIGLAERLYRDRVLLYEAASQMVVSCSCDSGCPSCVGVYAQGDDVKSRVRVLLKTALGNYPSETAVFVNCAVGVDRH